MRLRAAPLAVVLLAFVACGEFDVNEPPPWVKNLDGMLPAKRMRASELSDQCLARAFARTRCTVAPSRSLMRKAVLRLNSGNKVAVTYTPAEKGNPVIISVGRGDRVTVPIRKSGGTLELECTGINCVVTVE